MKGKIERALRKELEKIIKEKFEVEVQIDIVYGDYSTNAPLTFFHKVKDKYKNPIEFGNFLSKELQKNVPEVGKIEVSPPGFLNFFLSKKYLTEKLHQIASDENYGKPHFATSFVKTSKVKKAPRGKQKIMLEFADPNPFKEFHIGHLRNIALGESFSRLLEFQGAEVFRANYQGDVGMHVAKAIYGIQKSKFKIQNLKSKDKGAKFLGEAYAAGAKAYEEDKKAQEEIREINLKIYQKSDPGLNKLWGEGRKWSLEHFEDIYKRLGTKYKRYYFESEVEEPGREIVLSHIKDGIFERHEGAVVFRGKHTRVFVTSDGYGTYEAKDLALASAKFDDFPYDESIIITANEQVSYFKVVLQALDKVFPDLAKKTFHYSFGFVSLKDTKMSSRLGNIISGEWLFDETKRRLKENFEQMEEETLEKVAVGAVKYSVLKFSRKSDITFSFKESINLEGNSGPYIQYTFARTQSVLANARNSEFRIQNSENIKLEKEELLVLRLLIHFPEIVEEAGDSFAPNLLCNYLFELSQAFNNFYQKHKILESENEEFRLKLTRGVGQTLKTGLYLLGIESPTKM